MIKESLVLSVLALITVSGVYPWPINAQPQEIQPAPSSFGTSLQHQLTSEQAIEVEGPDIVLLSSRLNEQSFSDEIVGEVMNNGTESAEYVQALAVFRDAAGVVIDTALYADPHLIVAKDIALFKILLTSDSIGDEAMTYE